MSSINNKVLQPGAVTGFAEAPASKSIAHRLLICAALSGGSCELEIKGVSEDIKATMRCLRALGAEAEASGPAFCGESASTLRFLLPVAGALGKAVVFELGKRLAERPHDELIKVLRDHGMNITLEKYVASCCGTLEAGVYRIPGNISSQYVSGLLMALPLLKGDSVLELTEGLESGDYVLMTESVLKGAGIKFEKDGPRFRIPGGQSYQLAGKIAVEGDWSNAAPFLCMGALSEEGVEVRGLNPDSIQGDRAIIEILREFGARLKVKKDRIMAVKGRLKGICLEASGVPDLVPVVAALACGAEGETRITGASRLRLKESDRLKATRELLCSLGGDVAETEDGLIINGKGRLNGGHVNSYNDHRLAMAAAVAACICEHAVVVENPDCVNKSYPEFWRDLQGLKKV